MNTTRGPWAVSKSGKSVMGPKGERIADCRDPECLDDKNERANAQLIAMSPDLLDLLWRFETCAAMNFGPSRETVLMGLAREARVFIDRMG